MVEQTLSLLFKRWVRRDRFAGQCGLALSKQPRASEAGSSDHHAVDVVVGERVEHFIGAVQVTVTDQWDRF